MKEDQSFSNPIGPLSHVVDEKEDAKPLSNEDFRKLVMSTRGSGANGATSERVLGMGNSVRGVRVSGGLGSTSTSNATSSTSAASSSTREEREASDKKRKKKTEYLKQRKMELEKEAELAKKYRDRAKERRIHQENDDNVDSNNQTTEQSTTRNYHAVNPNAKEGETDRRRNQIIEESKFLGGDMEHTHLVKGLDYALLQKVKAEIHTKETEPDDEMQGILKTVDKNQNELKGAKDSPCLEVELGSRLAKNIHRLLFANELPEKNELFAPGRMAYLVELEDDMVDSDVPTTVVRSKVDCPCADLTSTTSSTNDVVVSKLTQILSYLRLGNRSKKQKKKLKDDKVFDPAAEEGIFGSSLIIGGHETNSNDTDSKRQSEGRGICKKRDGDCNDARSKDRDGRSRDRDIGGQRREGDHNHDRRDGDGSGDGNNKRETKVRFAYFDKNEETSRVSEPAKSATQLIKDINVKFANFAKPGSVKTKSESEQIIEKHATDCYSECYPGMNFDDVIDSDDEADYTKMDQGNKKGPVGRWDFETTEEYSNYMSHKEALPKAAFQFGVKMADGRKTRRVKPQTERQKLEREWKQISQILEKRRDDYDGGAKRGKY